MFYFGTEYFMTKYSVSNKPAALQQVSHCVYEEGHLHGQHCWQQSAFCSTVFDFCLAAHEPAVYLLRFWQK